MVEIVDEKQQEFEDTGLPNVSCFDEIADSNPIPPQPVNDQESKEEERALVPEIAPALSPIMDEKVTIFDRADSKIEIYQR